MKLRVIIADDEPLARERIRTLLAGQSDIEVLAECVDGAQTLKGTRERRPDLLFLDVQMPALSGFQVLEALTGEKMPFVIFTTAHDEHAIRAFEVNALDYLLKPFTEERFNKAVERARQHLEKEHSGPQTQVAALLTHLRMTPSAGGRILIKSAERVIFLKPEEIDHVEAAGNYVILHAGKERHMVRETTSAMEARLAPHGFMRLSRSAIVNLRQVREVQTIGPSQYSVLLKSGTRLDMTCSLSELQTCLSRI